MDTVELQIHITGGHKRLCATKIIEVGTVPELGDWVTLLPGWASCEVHGRCFDIHSGRWLLQFKSWAAEEGMVETFEGNGWNVE